MKDPPDGDDADRARLRRRHDRPRGGRGGEGRASPRRASSSSRATRSRSRPRKRLGAAEVITARKGAADHRRRRRAHRRARRGSRAGTACRCSRAASTRSTTRSARRRRSRSAFASCEPRGILSIIGVEAPKRFEWTPIYFKELRVVGSNAFGVEEFRGVRKHAIEHYVDLCASGEVDLVVPGHAPLSPRRLAIGISHRHDQDDGLREGRVRLPRPRHRLRQPPAPARAPAPAREFQNTG